MNDDLKNLIGSVARPVGNAAGYYIMMRAMSYVVGWLFGAFLILVLLFKLAC